MRDAAYSTAAAFPFASFPSAAITHLRPPSFTTPVATAIAKAIAATAIAFSIAASTEGGTLLQPD